MNKDLLRTREGIREIFKNHEIQIGTIVSWGGRCRRPKYARVDKKYCIRLKDVQSVLREFILENKNAKNGKNALYITERAVLEAREDGVYLLEIAPGVDIQKDIFNQMGFEPKIPEEGVKFMPLEIFEEEWFGLSAILDEKERKAVSFVPADAIKAGEGILKKTVDKENLQQNPRLMPAQE